MSHQPTYERVRSLFSYDPVSGVVTRARDQRGGVRAGDVVGTMTNKGYLAVRVDGKSYRLHRIIWAMMTGNWPSDQIDHINGSRADNRWVNLREATNSQNQHNTDPSVVNTSGRKGVSYNKSQDKWVAYIYLENVRYGLGTFGSFEEAVASREGAEALMHGTFARKSA